MAGIVRLYRGDNLIITRDPIPGRPAQFDDSGRMLRAASIACSLPEVFAGVRPGERILIDDGRIGGVIRDVNAGEIRVEITQARDCGEKLLADKSINLPDSDLDLDGLTAPGHHRSRICCPSCGYGWTFLCAESRRISHCCSNSLNGLIPISWVS